MVIIFLYIPPSPIIHGAVIQFSSTSGEIRDLLQTGANTIFAATQGGGVYKSTDIGTTWVKLSSFNERYVWRLASHPSNLQLLFAATTRGLLRSLDGGSTWTPLTFDNVRAVAVDPFNQNHILIGVPGGGIYASTDGGNSLSLANSGLDSLDISALAFDPTQSNVVYAGLNSNGTGGWGGVFKSTNGGTAWLNWNNPNNNGSLGNKFVRALVVDSQGSVHAGTYSPITYSGRLYKQTASNGWSLGQEVYGVETIVLDKSTMGKLWAGTCNFGPWISNNYGDSWSQAVDPSKDPDVYSTVYSIVTFQGSPGKALIGVKGLGLYQTLNSGGIWDLAGEGIKADRTKAIVQSPTNPNVYHMGLTGGGVMQSTDNGINWFDFNTGLEVASVENNLNVVQLGMSKTNPNNIYAATHGRGLFRWDGTQWSRVSESGLPNDSGTFLKPMGLLVDPVDDRIIYYSLFDSGQGVYKRNIAGTWSLVKPGPFSGAGASRIVMSPVDHSRIYALIFDDLPYKSADGGATWNKMNATHTGFMRLSFYALAENPLNPSIVLASTNKGLFKSTDGGDNWSRVEALSGLDSTILTGLAFSPAVNGRVWASDLAGGYYCSNDSGTTWIAVTNSPLDCAIADLQLIGGTLYLITDGCGVLKDTAPGCP